MFSLILKLRVAPALSGLVLLAACSTAPKDARVDDLVDGQKQGYILLSIEPASDIGRVDFQQIDRAKGTTVGIAINQSYDLFEKDRYRLLRVPPGDWSVIEIQSFRQVRGTYRPTNQTCITRGASEVRSLRLSPNDTANDGTVEVLPVPAGVPWLKVEPGKVYFFGDLRLQAWPCSNRIFSANSAMANRFMKEKYPLMPEVDTLTQLQLYKPEQKAP